MMLESASLGLGSVWICYFKPDVIKAEFALPDELVPVNILAVGYPSGDVTAPEKKRKSLDSFVCYDKLN